MSRPVDVQLVYFGKLPARGDFVRNGDALGLTDRLDQWLTHGLERMARDPRWKEHYDQAGAAHFAFLGVRSRAIVVGHLLASRDASGRRFPFVTAGRADVDQPLAFMRLAPLALQPVWDHLAQASAQAHAAADVVPGLNALCQAPARLESDPRRFLAQYHEFLEVHTLGQLQQSLHADGRPCDLRRALLALGLLLEPVPGSGVHQLAKGVQLPLPADPLLQPLAASLWIDLVSPFLARGDFEMAAFLPQPARPGSPSLALGFSGDSPALLHGLLDFEARGEHFIDLAAPDWVDDGASLEGPVRKLSSYLHQPQLSLAQARSTFNEAFLGA